MLLFVCLAGCAGGTERHEKPDPAIESVIESATESVLYETDEPASEEETDRETETATESALLEPTDPVYIPANTPASGNGIVIALDAGHKPGGGISEKEPNGPGSSVMKAKLTTGTEGSVDGVTYYEYAVNGEVTERLKAVLENRGYTVVTVDRNLSNAERAKQANAAGASVFIRIHCNGSDNPDVHGLVTYAAFPGNPYLSEELIREGQRLSALMNREICAVTGARDAGTIPGNDMTGINWCEIPVTIVEMGFMTNPDECRLLVSAAYQNLLAEGMANAIDAYLGL